ncbi:unnamed protein product [Auanema sp. JU1783]|nr:unnamed protein product [Auanema sp. JU1783]
MYRYQEGSIGSTASSARPASSLSSGSNDSGVFSVPQQGSGTQSRAVSGPPSPSFQINHLLHQAANLIAVNAQLRKEIEQVRASGASTTPIGSAGTTTTASVTAQPAVVSSNNSTTSENELVKPALSQEVFPFEPQNLPPHPASNRQSGKRSPKPDSYKTVMCQAWLESKVCLFGENCRFAHGEVELRPSRIQPKQNNKYKTKLCDKYTTSGLCPYGNRCLFIHPDSSGANAYIRPDKLLERHAMADLCQMADIVNRPSTPQNNPQSQSAVTALGPTPMRSVGNHLRPHPSWPLEPPTFFMDKEEKPNPLSEATLSSMFGDFKTPVRPSLTGSQGYVSGGSTPMTEVSPFSTVSSSSVNLNLTDDDRDFDMFHYSGLDSLTEELTRNLDLW